MVLGYQKKINIILTLSVKALIVAISLSTSSTEAKSFSINSLKHGTKEIQNKQSQNAGIFRLIHDSFTQYQSLQQIFEKSKIFEIVVAGLNKKKLNLSVNISIIFTDCGMANAFYNPETQQVVMCYELFEEMSIVFAQTGLSTEEAIEGSILAGIFMLYHEVGHALVDVLQLPITGKEEDTVDDFAAIMLLDSNSNEADQIVSFASIYFHSHSDSSYWDEHSFGKQRFYNLVCLLYGKNPQQYIESAREVGLEESRAQRCSGEYQQKVSSWQRLLAPHSINDIDTPTTTTSPIY